MQRQSLVQCLRHLKITQIFLLVLSESLDPHLQYQQPNLEIGT